MKQQNKDLKISKTLIVCELDLTSFTFQIFQQKNNMNIESFLEKY